MRLTELPQPVIARVQGIATAAGCQLVSMCDLAVAADTATFALPGVNIGVFCSTPAVGVARNVGRKRAMEMLLTGRHRCADGAGWGLVNRVVPADLDAAIAPFHRHHPRAQRRDHPPREGRFYAQIEHLAAALRHGRRDDGLQHGFDDAREGIDAFLEKRPAVWTGTLTRGCRTGRPAAISASRL